MIYGVTGHCGLGQPEAVMWRFSQIAVNALLMMQQGWRTVSPDGVQPCGQLASDP